MLGAIDTIAQEELEAFEEADKEDDMDDWPIDTPVFADGVDAQYGAGVRTSSSCHFHSALSARIRMNFGVSVLVA